ncbi:hypothetical protein RUM44_006326 [Polyplax serrata]|uniref:Uncharacterized protein n=1 Tax=Polyplax serrata TaxID=468196 RepID=A0ABR1AJH9_POLSC
MGKRRSLLSSSDGEKEEKIFAFSQTDRSEREQKKKVEVRKKKEMLRALRPLSASSSGLPPGFQVLVPCSSPRYGGICKSKGTMKIQKSKSKFQNENGDGHKEDETAEIQVRRKSRSVNQLAFRH